VRCLDPGARRELVYHRRVHRGLGVEIALLDALVAREAGVVDAPGGAALVPVVAFGHHSSTRGADTALLAPDRAVGLVLFETVVSGAPEPDLDTQRFDGLLDAAIAAGNLEEVNRLETLAVAGRGPGSGHGRLRGA
jgi:hypothetical protein